MLVWVPPDAPDEQYEMPRQTRTIAMKLRVPEGCCAISHQGQTVEIGEDCSIEVDDAVWSVFSAHGFRPWADGQPAPEVADMTREELVVAAMNASLLALQTTSAEEIRARLIASQGSVVAFGQASQQATSMVDADVESISTLNRQGLFAFLKAKGVSVSLPVTNEELRALARQSMG
jgi:hypothetical protein